MQMFHNFKLDPELVNYLPILDSKYRIIQTIGEGRFAKVKYCRELETNKEFAIKIMRKNACDTESKLNLFINEVKILSELEHKRVIKIFFVNFHGRYRKANGTTYRVLYYVMQFAMYGELFQFLDLSSSFSEQLSRYYFRQLIEGIEYMHRRGIGHLDIKTENLLINKECDLKIVDFGFAKQTRNEQGDRIQFDSQINVGSPEYNPPEITSPSKSSARYFCEEVDVFASACVLFLLVMRSAPFQNSGPNDPYYQRLQAEDTSHFWKIFSCNCHPTTEFKQIIEQLLKKDPSKRLTINQIKKHPWYIGSVPSKEEVKMQINQRMSILVQQKFNDLHKKRIQKLTQRKNTFQLEQSELQKSAFQHRNRTQSEVNINTYSLSCKEGCSDLSSCDHHHCNQQHMMIASGGVKREEVTNTDTINTNTNKNNEGRSNSPSLANDDWLEECLVTRHQRTIQEIKSNLSQRLTRAQNETDLTFQQQQQQDKEEEEQQMSLLNDQVQQKTSNSNSRQFQEKQLQFPHNQDIVSAEAHLQDETMLKIYNEKEFLKMVDFQKSIDNFYEATVTAQNETKYMKHKKMNFSAKNIKSAEPEEFKNTFSPVDAVNEMNKAKGLDVNAQKDERPVASDSDLSCPSSGSSSRRTNS